VADNERAALMDSWKNHTEGTKHVNTARSIDMRLEEPTGACWCS
jgi:hypothetical protein